MVIIEKKEIQNQDLRYVPVASQASGQVPSPDSRFHGRPRVRSVPGLSSGPRPAPPPGAPAPPPHRQLRIRPLATADVPRDLLGPSRHASSNHEAPGARAPSSPSTTRKRVGKGQSVSICVEIGGRLSIK